MQRLRLSVSTFRRLRVLPLALLVCLGFPRLSAWAQPTNFAHAQVLTGIWGSVTNDNTLGGQDISVAGFAPHASIWYKWTAPNDGEVSMDTLNSLSGFSGLDTALGVYTGPDLVHLAQVAANDDFLPFFNITDSVQQDFEVEYFQNLSFSGYNGPSRLTFNAVSNTVYYIAVDTIFKQPVIVNGTAPVTAPPPPSSIPTGNVVLNWAYHPTGTFRFATEDFDQFQAALTPMVQCSDMESILGNESTFYSYYTFDPLGVQVTVTRVAGSVGRVMVDYTTQDGTAFAQQDYLPVSGTLVFDDFEMSKTIVIQTVYPHIGTLSPPGVGDVPFRDFSVVLSNPRLDPFEDNVSLPQPKIDQILGVLKVRILSSSALGNDSKEFPDPKSGNIDNDIFNFEKAHYSVPEDINDYWSDVLILVFRTLNNNKTSGGDDATLNFRIDNFHEDGVTADFENNLFPLTPGSDYATIDRLDKGTNDPGSSTFIHGKEPDFFIVSGTFNGSTTTVNGMGDGGTINMPHTSGSGAVRLRIRNDALAEFNEDIRISLWRNHDSTDWSVGQISQTIVTIMTDDFDPPAGSLDEFHAPDHTSTMATPLPVYSDPPDLDKPGADGQVMALLVLTNSGNQTVIAGDFHSYNTYNRNCIARLNLDGSLDFSFDPHGGANGFINAIAQTSSSQFIIGGGFSSYDGTTRNHIAQLNQDGSLDSSFEPGQGFDAPIRSIYPLTNGQFVVAGDFTSYRGLSCSHVARLNSDASLDTSFSAPTISGLIGATVNSIAVDSAGRVVLGGDFTSIGTRNLAYLARLNSNGSLDQAFANNLSLGSDGRVYSVAIDNNGRILVVGAFSKLNSTPRSKLLRLNATGTLDTSFDPGTGADNTIYTINPYFDGTNTTIYIGGAFTTYNGTHRLGFARLFPDGTLDTSFLDAAYNQFAGLHRRRFSEPVPFVLAAGVQSDGNVMIGGNFQQVGGGQFSPDAREDVLDPPNINANVLAQPKSRDGLRNRSNVARLIGGATEGPGNLLLTYPSYSVNRSQSSLTVSISRTNGNLGYISANFSVPSGTATNGVDYTYSGAPPFFGSTWILDFYFPASFPHAATRMHSDGLLGTNTAPVGYNGVYWFRYTPSILTLGLNHQGITPGDHQAQFKLANPPGADQFFLGGANIPLGTALGRSTAPITIVDDNHNVGTLNFASPTYSTNENAGLALISVVRTGGSYGGATFHWSTVPGTAVIGSDYTPASGNLTFFAGQTNLYFQVPLINNTNLQPQDRTVGLALSSPSTGLGLGLTNATLFIIDDDFPLGYVNFDSANLGTNVSAGSINLPISRIGGSRGAISVRFTTANITAIDPTDYIGVSTNLIWNDGESGTKYVTIRVNDPHQVGPTLTFLAQLSNPIAYGTNAPTILSGPRVSAVVTLTNDNRYGNLAFSAPAYTVNENGGYATISVVRSGGSSQTLTVNFATANGSAVALGSGPVFNYYPTNGTLTFGPGEVSKSFNVALNDDGVRDNLGPSDFYFVVNLSGLSPAGATFGFPIVAKVQLVDAEAFDLPAGSPDTAFVPTPGFNGDVYSVALQTDGGIVAGGVFTTANGAPRGHIARLNFDSSLDSLFQPTSSGANGVVNAVLVQSDARILAGGAFTIMNGVNRFRIARLLSDGSLDSSFDPGAGADGPVAALAETFAPGTTNRSLLVGGNFLSFGGGPHRGLVRMGNDGVLDPSFNPSLNINGNVYAIAAYSNNTANAGKIIIGGDFTSINGNGRNGVARLNYDGSLDLSFNPGSGVSNAVRTIAIQLDGGILLGGSFTNFNGLPFNHVVRLTSVGAVDPSFNPGAGANDTVNQIILQPDNRIVMVGLFTRANGVARARITRLLPDGSLDPAINFGFGADNFINTVALQSDGKFVIGGGFSQFDLQPRSRIARLYGNSIAGSGNFTFTSSQFQADENATNVIINVRRAGGLAGAVSVDVLTSDGTAVAGINYSNVSTTLTFPAGEAFQSLVIPLIDDQKITPDLFLNLTLQNPSAPAQLGSQYFAQLDILNDDSAISFVDPTPSVKQNLVGGLAIINLARQGSVRGSASVDFFTSTNGTAILNTDYLAVSNTVTFLPGQSNASVVVPILNDPIMFSDRTVDLQLTNAINALLFSPSAATLTIISTNASPGQFVFSQTNFLVGEGDGFAAVTVLRTNGHANTITVQYRTSDGTAIAPFKYAATNGTLTFLDGELSKTILVPIYEENQVEGNQTFFVSLFNPSRATILGPNLVTVTILDDDQGVMFFPDNGGVYNPTETDGSVTITVNRVVTNGITTVHYATTNGTALAGTNYLAKSGDLTFNNGESVKTFPITLLRDPRVTGPLSFTIGLSNPLNVSNPSAQVQLGTPSIALVNIQDADPGISFLNTNSFPVTNVNFYTGKSAGSILISVVRSNANTGVVSVNYATTNGTAVAGPNGDYLDTHGTLTFSNGIALQTFTVPIINNHRVEGDTFFNINLTTNSASGGAQLLAPYFATVTITDDVSGLSFSSPSYSVGENGGGVGGITIPVLRTGFTNSTVRVDFATANGTAVAFGTGPNYNYYQTSGTLIFTNGETMKSFFVQVVDNTIVDGDKTVLLSLANIVGNAGFVNPSAATLTILETDGSLIQPAGSALISESGPVNGIIDPGETVTSLFALHNVFGTNTLNLTATLLPTNGISNPSAPQNYGALVVHGPSASRPFTFTASATNGQLITAVFQLRDGSTVLSNVVFNFLVGQTILAYSNTTPIIINDFAAASPYPSSITVNGLGNSVTKATVTLTNLSHTWPSDIDVLLVSPAGQKSLLMAKAGSSFSVNNITLGFDDSAPGSLPQSAKLVSSTNRPSSYAIAPPPFPVSASISPPPPPYAANLSTFNGNDPNGTWLLYVYDDTRLNSGAISNGWLLYLTTAATIVPVADLGIAMFASQATDVQSSNLTYTISITNYGPSVASNILVTDILPAGALWVANTPFQGPPGTNGIVSWSIASLALGASTNLFLTVQPIVVGLLTNSATVSAATSDLNAEDDTASVVTLVTSPTADLVLGLTGGPDPLFLGGNLTYSISITNLGPGTAPVVTLTDTLPPSVLFVSASPAGYTVAGSVVTFTNLGSLGSGGRAVASVVVKPLVAGTFTNTASCAIADPTVFDPFKPNNSASVKTIVQSLQMSFSHSGNNLTISWASDANSVLESSPSLFPPSWTVVSSPQPITSGGITTITLPIGSGNRFFRLRATP
jgi:uncharacterized delta-60 repeat protein/uncharacterized repeat protein (TIGR01451 family)